MEKNDNAASVRLPHDCRTLSRIPYQRETTTKHWHVRFGVIIELLRALKFEMSNWYDSFGRDAIASIRVAQLYSTGTPW
jgi:hypothetical protein